MRALRPASPPSLCPAAPALVAQAGAPRAKPKRRALLDSIGENLLCACRPKARPRSASTPARARALRSQLADRSQAGQRQLAATLRADLARAEAVDIAALTHSTRTSVEVVRCAYRTALDGFALPYGDVAVGGWRNTPYVVIQNVGAYLDVPRFLDTDHPVENAADAEAYLARLDSYPAQLDGELGRLKAAARARAWSRPPS